MVQNEKELVYLINPIEYSKGGKVFGIANILIIRILYEAFSEKAYCVFRLCNLEETKVLEEGNQDIEIHDWKDDDSSLVDYFAKQNNISIEEKISHKDLMLKLKKIDLDKQLELEKSQSQK